MQILHGKRDHPFRCYSRVETRLIGIEPLRVAQRHVVKENHRDDDGALKIFGVDRGEPGNGSHVLMTEREED